MKSWKSSVFVLFASIVLTLTGTSVAGATPGDICAIGLRQSPIDIPEAPDANLPHLVFKYHPTPLEVENTGYTIEVPVEPGSILRIGQERYRLLQFHFHTPSEHTLHGEEFPMELHFVHQNPLGELAVVGVFMQEGEANEVIQEIWDHIPE